MKTDTDAASLGNGRTLADTRRRARRLGLSPEDADDCAVAFVERELRREAGGGALSSRQPVCAENFVRDFRRVLVRRWLHERSWQENARLGEPPAAPDLPDTAPGPESCLLRGEFWRAMRVVLKHLDPVQRKMFLRHRLRGQSIQELVAWSGLTPHVVEQRLYRARERLREILLRRGLTEAELRSYLP